jgi:predicted nucleotidyltransferase
MSDIDKAVTRLVADLDGAGLGGYSAVLYGSAARGQYLPGWSDINVVLIVDHLETDTLERLHDPLVRWREVAGDLPLLLTRAEWQRSADAYPLEIAEMRTAYRVLRGADPLAGVSVRPADLRQALERELRGKLLRLRQGYALLHGNGPELGQFVRRSVSTILFLSRGLLILVGQSPPPDPVDLVQAAGRAAGFDGDQLARIVTRRGVKDWACSESDMRGYLAAVESAARFVDHFQTGDRG